MTVISCWSAFAKNLHKFDEEYTETGNITNAYIHFFKLNRKCIFFLFFTLATGDESRKFTKKQNETNKHLLNIVPQMETIQGSNKNVH